jgi:hypothetical protein
MDATDLFYLAIDGFNSLSFVQVFLLSGATGYLLGDSLYRLIVRPRLFAARS